jgi:hypothetical protein
MRDCNHQFLDAPDRSHHAALGFGWIKCSNPGCAFLRYDPGHPSLAAPPVSDAEKQALLAEIVGRTREEWEVADQGRAREEWLSSPAGRIAVAYSEVVNGVLHDLEKANSKLGRPREFDRREAKKIYLDALKDSGKVESAVQTVMDRFGISRPHVFRLKEEGRWPGKAVS